MDGIERILILDCGSQHTQSIARKIREIGVYSDILPWDTSVERILSSAPKGIVISGFARAALQEGAPHLPEAVFKSGIPILGVGYGMALIAHQLGGRIEAGNPSDCDAKKVALEKASALFENLPESLDVRLDEWERVLALPTGASVTATAEGGEIAAFSLPGDIHALRFHPEFFQSPEGERLLCSFARKVCGCAGEWELEPWVARTVEGIKAKVGSGRVVAGLSGGVDSTVGAVLTARAIGKQLDCIFVDHGFLRKDEAKQVLETYKQLDLQVHFVDATQSFAKALEGVDDPEGKRKIIGELFVRVFEAEAKKLGGASWLLQGTIYPDVIESGTSANEVIKSHHNVGGLPEDMEMSLLEPLRDLFKDEVKKIGAILGISRDFLQRHPFPGPGLAVRCLGELRRERLDTLREADAIFLEEIKRAGLYSQIWQAFCVLIPTRSVGVSGDSRTYNETVALRAVSSLDAMTARWVRLPWELLDTVSHRICTEVAGVGRVVFDVSNKPPATIEWE